jgi:Flp pilus assembly pilin Flp
MRTKANRFLHQETAEDLIEYGLLAAFVAAIAVACIIADPLGLKRRSKARTRTASTR